MAYLPPLNGGRINASISSAGGGSAAGAALISSGTLNLVAGTNITLSQAGGNVTIQGPNAGGGSIQFSAGGNSSSLASVNFSASNGIGFGLNGSVITASHNGLTTQSAQAASAANGSFAFQTLAFSNANNVSFGTSANGGNSAITASISVSPTGIQAVSAGGASQSSGTLTFLNANGIGFGLNNGSITASYTQQNMFDGGMLAATSGGGTFGIAGTNSIGMALAAGRNITLSQSTDGNGASVTLNSPVFSNSNNINFGTNGSVVTASYAGGGGLALSAPGSSFSSGTLNFGVTGGNLTVTGEGSSINFAAPAVSNIVGANNMSVVANGNTISISDVTPIGSYYDNLVQGGISTGLSGQNIAYASMTAGAAAQRLLIQPLDPANDFFPFNMTISTLMMNFSNNGGTATSAAHTSTYYFGLYTRVNSTQLSLVNSASMSLGLTANSNNYLSYQGARWLTLHSSQFSKTPVMSNNQRYYFGWMVRTSNTYYSGNSVGGLYYGQSAVRSGLMGQSSSSNTSLYAWNPFMGVYTNTSVSSMPVSIANSEINKNSTYANFIPQVVFNGGGAQMF